MEKKYTTDDLQKLADKHREYLRTELDPLSSSKSMSRIPTAQYIPPTATGVASGTSSSGSSTSPLRSSSLSPLRVGSPDVSFLPQNSSILMNARRLLNEANKSTGLAASQSTLRSSTNNINATTNTTLNASDTSDLSVFLNEKSSWEQRMRELESRLKSVQTQQSAIGASASTSFNKDLSDVHSVHNTGLVYRLEQELRYRNDALLQERNNHNMIQTQLKQRIDELNEQLLELKTRTKQQNSRWMEEFERVSAETHIAIQALQAKNASINEELDNIRSHNNGLQQKLAASDKQHQASRFDVETLTNQLHQARGKYEELLEELKNLQREIANCRQEKERIEHESRRHEQELRQDASHHRQLLQDTIDKLQDDMRNERNQLNNTWEKERNELANKFEKDKSSFKLELSKSESRVRELEHDNFVLSNEFTSLKATNTRLEQENHSLKQQLLQEMEAYQGRAGKEKEHLQLEHKLNIQKFQYQIEELQILMQQTTSKLEHEMKEKQQLKTQLEQSIFSSSASSSDLQKKLADDLHSKQSQILELQHVHSSQTTIVQQLRHQLEELRNENDALQKRLDARPHAHQIQVLENEVQRLTVRAKRSDELEHEVQQYNMRLAEANNVAKQKEEAYEQTIEELQAKVTKLRGKIAKLKQSLQLTSIDALALAEKDRAIAALQQEQQARVQAEKRTYEHVRHIQDELKREKVKYEQLISEFDLAKTSNDSTQYNAVYNELLLSKQSIHILEEKYVALRDKYEKQKDRTQSLQELVSKLESEKEHWEREQREHDRILRTGQSEIILTEEEESMFKQLLHAQGGSSSSKRASSVPRSSAPPDREVNVHLKLNVDKKLLAELKKCNGNGEEKNDKKSTDSESKQGEHSPIKLHDSRTCRICQRRAFQRGLDLNKHFGSEAHVHSSSPVKHS